MRILQIIQKLELRGAGIFACQLSNHLQELGHEVFMISLLPGDAILPFNGKVIQLDRPHNKRFTDFAGWKKLFEQIKGIKPDIIQANAADTLKFTVFSRLFFHWKVPIVFRNANKVSGFIDSWPKLIYNKFLVARVDHIISVSELCRLDFIGTYSLRADKTTTVPIGIELHLPSASLPSDLVPVFASRKVLVNVASFVPEKNHAGLLRIIQHLVLKGENVCAVLIGDGKLRSKIEQQIVDMNLKGHVFLLGFRNDVLSIVAKAHAFILPSAIEGLPGVILEAMFCHTPVVAYDVGGIAEVVKQGKTGWLVKAGDETGFVTAIIEVLHSHDLETIKNNAHDMVVTDYDNRAIAKRFLEVYHKLN